MGSKQAFLSLAIVLLISSEAATSYLPETLSDQKNVEATKEANYGGSGGNLGGGLRNAIIHDLSQRISIHPGDRYGRYPQGRELKDCDRVKCCRPGMPPKSPGCKECCQIKAKPQY